jgi:UDPglucose--hexose-1-phosphate uridylyltransferase
MELRKDPITRSWVITGEGMEASFHEDGPCRFCAGSSVPMQVVSSTPSVDGGPWSARAVVHPAPLYRIEGDPQRGGNGLYDIMRTVGAHEVLVETPHHDRPLWKASDAEIAQFLTLAAQRIQDLKRDPRFKYVTIFKNQGAAAGQEFAHPTWLLTATTFVPRRVLYELRAAREYYEQKERCVLCDILAQEQRQNVRIVESIGDYVASCPYAPRVPYETWIMPNTHEASFEAGVLRRTHLNDLAALLRRTLIRLRAISEDFHLVVHTTPNTKSTRTLGYWTTLDEDYHWHIEIMPIVPGRSKSYTFKEVYYSDVTPESAAQRLRDASPTL